MDIKEAKKLPILMETDVLVVGGGPAGIARRDCISKKWCKNSIDGAVCIVWGKYYAGWCGSLCMVPA